MSILEAADSPDEPCLRARGSDPSEVGAVEPEEVYVDGLFESAMAVQDSDCAVESVNVKSKVRQGFEKRRWEYLREKAFGVEKAAVSKREVKVSVVIKAGAELLKRTVGCKESKRFSNAVVRLSSSDVMD